MFHLSLPVDRYQECIAFYRSCFDARIVELTPTAANIFAFGAQITLHDAPSSPLSGAARTQLHFGRWFHRRIGSRCVIGSSRRAIAS
jgi:catechol 2,3-dioxygenase-like lactoylglutathione lyase family enzyme